MPKQAKELTAIEVQRIVDPPGRFVGGCVGLFLQVAPSGARSWLLKYKLGEKRRRERPRRFPDRDAGYGPGKRSPSPRRHLARPRSD